MFLNALFLVKEGNNNKILAIILFVCSRGVGKSLFRCSRPKDTDVMSICLCHIEVIVHDQFFFVNFVFSCNEDR